MDADSERSTGQPGGETASEPADGDATRQGWLSRHAPALVGAAVAVAGVVALALASGSRREFGTILTCSAGAFAVGALLGFVVGGPGAEGGETGTASANRSGWSSRLGVFGTWLTGAAFALALSNWSELADWFATVSRTAATSAGGSPRPSTQYAFGAAMITAAAGGFIFGFVQMASSGRVLFASVEAETRRLERGVQRVQAATEQLEAASQSAVDAAAQLDQARSASLTSRFRR